MPAAPFAELRDGLVEFRLGHGPVAIGVEALEHRLGARCPAALPRIGQFLERSPPRRHRHRPVPTSGRHRAPCVQRLRPASRPGRARRRHWRRPRRTGPRGRLPSLRASPHRRRSGPSPRRPSWGHAGGPSCATAGRTRAVGIMRPKRAAFHIDMRLLLCLPVCPLSRRSARFRRKKFGRRFGMDAAPARGHVRP
jgi:hypothetical protein